MVKKILFLYTDSRSKREISDCESVLKALFRKFRISPIFRYMPIDTSPSCNKKVKEALLAEIPLYDAVFLCNGRDTDSDADKLTAKLFGTTAVVYYPGEKALCYPLSDVSFSEDDSSLSKSVTIPLQNIKDAAKISMKLALGRQRRITFCMSSDDKLAASLSEKYEMVLQNDFHIIPEHITPEEMMTLYSGSIPSFDVVLTTEELAKLIAVYLNALKNVPYAYLIYHTDMGRIYTRGKLPFDGIGNSSFISDLMAFSSLLNNELDMKSASVWLRRSAALACETFGMASHEEITNMVISEINKPMRNSKRTDR